MQSLPPTSSAHHAGDAKSSVEKAGMRVETTDGDVFEADAVVLAVGISAAKVGSSCFNLYIGTFYASLSKCTRLHGRLGLTLATYSDENRDSTFIHHRCTCSSLAYRLLRHIGESSAFTLTLGMSV